MKNTLTDLNNILFEQLERINDDDLSEEELKKTITKAEVITKTAETVIKNGELMLKTAAFIQEYMPPKGETPVMLALKNNIGGVNEKVQQ